MFTNCNLPLCIITWSSHKCTRPGVKPNQCFTEKSSLTLASESSDLPTVFVLSSCVQFTDYWVVKLFTATLDQALKITDESVAVRRRQRQQLQRLCPSSRATLMEVHYDKNRWDEMLRSDIKAKLPGWDLQSYSHETEKVIPSLGQVNKISNVSPSIAAVKGNHLHRVNYCNSLHFFL